MLNLLFIKKTFAPIPLALSKASKLSITSYHLIGMFTFSYQISIERDRPDHSKIVRYIYIYVFLCQINSIFMFIFEQNIKLKFVYCILIIQTYVYDTIRWTCVSGVEATISDVHTHICFIPCSPSFGTYECFHDCLY